MLTEHQIEVLCEAWKAVFGDYPHIERGDNPVDDAQGPEICIDGFLSLWAAEIEHERQSIIGPIHRIFDGYITGIVTVQYNYPHAPDEADVGDEEEHDTFHGALARLIREAAVARLDGYMDTLETTALAEQLASEARV